VTERSVAAYYENTARWSDTVRTLLGVRADRYDFDVASDLAANSGRVHDTLASPKASVVLGPFAASEVFLNWGRGFHSNDARGATLAVDPATGGAAARVTPLVRSTGYEAGWRFVPRPGLQVSVAAWQLELASELVFSGDAGTTEASRPSRRRGVEWSNHYANGDHLLLDLDVSLSRARFRDDDPAGPFVPGAIERVISGGVTLVDWGPWSGSLQVRHFGPRALVEDASVRSQATTLANLRTGYRLSRQWSAALDVFNVFDRRASDIDYFYASRLRGEPVAGVEDVHFHPVEPRTLRFTLTARF
jgi:outer membrane receptor protein involved in Fe transport